MGTTASGWSEAIALGRARNGLVAAGAFRIRRRLWNPLLHPRGANGQFIKKGGRVKWRDRDSAQMWRTGDVVEITDKGKAKVRDTDGNVSIRDPKTLYTVATPIARINPNSWKKVGAQAGSNPGGFFENPQGEKHYVKTMPPDRVSNEVAATQLYALAGAAVPEVTSSPDGKKFITKIQNSDAFFEITDPELRREAEKAVAKDFVIDAWLANWDAPHNDNIRFTEMGDAIRVDTGGSLDYRARGAKKGSAFGPVVDELKTMREFQGVKNPVYAAVTKENEEDGARRILAIHPDEIREVIKDNGLPSTVAETLIARRAYLANHYGFELPETTPEGKAILARAAKDADDDAATPSVSPPAQRPNLATAVKRADPNAMPLAPDSPVWLKKKPDAAKGQGDIWTIKNVSADKTTADLESAKTGKLIKDVSVKDFQTLRANFTAPKTFYTDGKTVPAVNDRVRAQDHGDGTVKELFPRYAKVGFDAGGDRVMPIVKLDHLTGDDAAPDTTNAPDTKAPTPKKAAPRRSLSIPGDEFDPVAHDWEKDPNPKIFDADNGRETQVIMPVRNPKGDINGLLVPIDDTFGETAIIAPKKARVAGTMTKDDYDNWKAGRHVAKGASTATKVPAHERRQKAIDEMDTMAAKALKPKAIPASLHAAKYGRVTDDNGNIKDEYKEFYELRPGDELLQITHPRRASVKHTFLHRDGKMHFIGSSMGAKRSYTSFGLPFVNNTPDIDATEDYENMSSGWSVTNRTPPEFAKAAQVLGTSGARPEKLAELGTYTDRHGVKHDAATDKLLGARDPNVDIDHNSRRLEFIAGGTASQKDIDKIEKLKEERLPEFIVSKVEDANGSHTGEWDAYVVGYGPRDHAPNGSVDKSIMLAPEERIKLTEAQKNFYFSTSLDTLWSGKKVLTVEQRSAMGMMYADDNKSVFADDVKPLKDDEHLTTFEGTPLDKDMMKNSRLRFERYDSSAIALVRSTRELEDKEIYSKRRTNQNRFEYTTERGRNILGMYPKGDSVVPIPNQRSGGKDTVIANIDVSTLKPGEKVDGFGAVWTERNLTPLEAFMTPLPSKKGDLEAGKFDDDIFRTAMRDTYGPDSAMLADDGSTQRDPALYEFTRHMNGNSVPLKLPPKAMAQYREKHNLPTLYRGVVTHTRDFRYGTFYQGYGAFGNGTYTTTRLATAKMYAGSANRNAGIGDGGRGITKLTPKHTAVIADQNSVLKGMNKFIGKTSDDILEEMSSKGLMPDKKTLERIGDDETYAIDPDIKKELDNGPSRSHVYGSIAKANASIRDRTARQATTVLGHLKNKGFNVKSIEYEESPLTVGSRFKFEVTNPRISTTDTSRATFEVHVGNVDIFRPGISHYNPSADTKHANLIIGLRHSPDRRERRRTQFHNNMSFSSTPMYGTDPVRATQALAIMNDLDIGPSTPEYFDDDGKLVKNAEEFQGNVQRLYTKFVESNGENARTGSDERRNPVFQQYDPQKSIYREDVREFLDKNLSLIKKMARRQFGSESGRYAIANGIDAILIGQGSSEEYYAFTNRNAIVMEKNW